MRVPAASGALCTIAYGWLPGTSGSTVPKLQAVTSALPPEHLDWARDRLAKVGRFVPTGQHTMTLEPNPAGFVDVDAFVAALEEIAEVIAGRLAPA